MVRKFVIAASMVGFSAACATAQDVGTEAPGWLSKDFAELVALFDGQWDNDRHVFFAEDAGMDTTPIAPRQHIHIRRLELEADQQSGESPIVEFEAARTVAESEPAHIRHLFSIDTQVQSIRQSMAVLKEDGTRRGIGCEVLWNRQGAQFEGHAVGAGCDDVFPEPKGDAQLNVRMTLSENDFWVVAHRGEALTEARFRRARPFECWTAILRGASHGDTGEGMRDWDFRRGVELHDQGGEAELITDEETPRKIRLKLRNVDWPYGTNRPSLTLYIMEGESDRAVSYAWNEGDAERIGINLRWIQASCTHAPAADE